MPVYCIDLTSYNTLARHRGIGRYTYYLANELHKLKAELRPDERLVASVSMRGERAISDEIRPQFHEEELPPIQKQSRAFDRFWMKRWLFLRQTLRSAAPDVMHFVEGPQTLPSRAYRSVVTCHDIIPLMNPAHYIRDSWRREPIARAKDYLRYTTASRLIAVSQATALDLEREMLIPRSRITVIPQGVDLNLYRPEGEAGERERISARYGLPARYSLYVGANDWRKRIELLLRSYGQVYKATGVPLVLVGAWTLKVPRGVKEALSYLPAGAVVQAGEVKAEDLPAIYRAADLHVLPSVYEGFGLTVLEAMACGCPVVTTRCGALPEAAGDAARFFTADNITELEEALARVLQDPALRAQMRAKGLAHVAQFSWERTARATLEVYREAAGLRAASRHSALVNAL